MDLSVLIPSRNEIFLSRTIENVLSNIKADTEIIAILDGSWPNPPVQDHPRVNIVHFSTPIGQRAATNAGARLSQADYIMKLDAHCMVGEGFDEKLIRGCQPDWTLVPIMYNLHAFDWVCQKCGHRKYQGPKPDNCEVCGYPGIEMDIVWQPRWKRKTYSWRFDKDLHFQYWRAHRKRKETWRGEYIETMSFIGACFFMPRERFWELDGMDERHGSWGQVGTEIACKSWLSGGKLLTCKRTWFAHMFRTKSGKEWGFPYEISGNAQQRAKDYSYDFWTNNRWPKQVHPLSWLIERYWPVPGWDQEDLGRLKERE